jgi:prevent-host-death family protein
LVKAEVAPMRQVNILEAKTQLSRLVDAVESGAENEIVIARNGRPAVRLVPLKQEKRPVRLGLGVGKYGTFDKEAFDRLDSDVGKLFGTDT